VPFRVGKHRFDVCMLIDIWLLPMSSHDPWLIFSSVLRDAQNKHFSCIHAWTGEENVACGWSQWRGDSKNMTFTRKIVYQ